MRGMLACNIFPFITNARGWIFNQIRACRRGGYLMYRLNSFPPTMLDSYWNIPWERFYLDKGSCLVCTIGIVGHYIQWDYYEEDENFLMISEIFVKKWTFPIKRESSYCQGAVTGSSVGMVLISCNTFAMTHSWIFMKKVFNMDGWGVRSYTTPSSCYEYLRLQM